MLPLLQKACNAMLTVDVDHAEMARFGWIGGQSRDRDIGASVLMLFEHTPVIHLVNMVAGEDEHILRLFRTNGIDVLIDRVRRSHVPVFADPLHGRQNFDKFADLAPENVPAFANLTIQRQRLVLREDKNAAQAGIDTVRKRDVDDAIDAAEGHGRFGAIASKGIEALSSASGEQNSERIFHSRTVTGTPSLVTAYRCNMERERCFYATRHTST